MPGGDRTGPLGYGPMTGRGTGYCASNSVSNYPNSGIGGGRGRGFGRGQGHPGGRGMAWRHGRGWRGGGLWGDPGPQGDAWPGFSGASRDVELNILQEQASYLNNVLEDIKTRIIELEQETAKEK